MSWDSRNQSLPRVPCQTGILVKIDQGISNIDYSLFRQFVSLEVSKKSLRGEKMAVLNDLGPLRFGFVEFKKSFQTELF